MALDLNRFGEVIIAQPHERLDVASAPAFDAAVTQAFRDGGKHVVIDLSTTQYVSSIGMAGCLKAAKAAQAAGGRAALAGLSDMLTEIFEVSGFVELFDVHPTYQDALGALGGTGAAREPATVPVVAKAPAAAPLFTLPEEILLLALHDEGGELLELPPFALDFALASAVLMELVQRRRIDGDLQSVDVADTSPLDDAVLDPALAALARATDAHDARHWVNLLAHEADAIRERVLDRLVARGVLKRAGNRLLWALGVRKYPLVDDREPREVKQRVLGVIRSREIPDPRDVVIIALADACAIFDALLSMDEMLEARPRIAEVVRLDLFAQAMTQALGDMQTWGTWHAPPAGIYSDDRSTHV